MLLLCVLLDSADVDTRSLFQFDDALELRIGVHCAHYSKATAITKRLTGSALDGGDRPGSLSNQLNCILLHQNLVFPFRFFKLFSQLEFDARHLLCATVKESLTVALAAMRHKRLMMFHCGVGLCVRAHVADLEVETLDFSSCAIDDRLGTRTERARHW